MRHFVLIICACVAAAVLVDLSPSAGRAQASAAISAPEFTHTTAGQWLNSPPLKLTELRGQVVLVEFWAFDCVNCRRTVAWLHSVQKKHATQNLKIVAVHTPELAEERSADNVRAAIAQQHINYPVMLDADYSYWKALNNQYWPAFYLIDAQGRIAAQAIGEMHVDEPRAVEFEGHIDALLVPAH